MYISNNSIIGYKPLAIMPIATYISTLPHPSYTVVDCKSILTSYNEHCKKVDIDPYLAIAQMCHETDYCRSWWSQRPRRNPAGIRVTGERTLHLASNHNPKEWQYDSVERLWKRGLAFSSWAESSATHIGHLLCYMLYDYEMSIDQLLYSALSPNKQMLNNLKYRGLHTIDGLNGRWAYPGTYYSSKIAEIANKLQSVE